MIVISYPRSGRTWLLRMLAKLKQADLVNHLKNEHEYTYTADGSWVKGMHEPEESELKTIKSRTDCRTIYLARHPFDVIVSYYYYLTHYKKNPIQSFFAQVYWSRRHKLRALAGDWAAHVQRYAAKSDQTVKYEELAGNTAGVLSRLTGTAEDDYLHSVIKEFSFKNTEKRSEGSESKKSFNRSGMPGEGMFHPLVLRDYRALKKITEEAASELGYQLDSPAARQFVWRRWTPLFVLRIKDFLIRCINHLRFKLNFGRSLSLHNDFYSRKYLKELYRRKHLKESCIRSSDLCILTWSNYPEKTCLEKSLDYLGISDYAVLGRGAEDWTNEFKIKTTLDFLTSGERSEKYVLWADSRDVVFMGDPARALSLLKKSGARMLFSSTEWFHPDCPELKQFEESVEGAENAAAKYLNSGVMIGERDFVVQVLKDCLPYMGKKLSGFMPTSDQIILTKMHEKFYPDIKVDYKQDLAVRRPGF